jgi:nucleoside 2-deoxyribosyltransferase
MKHKIYLVGQISGYNPKSYEWRENVRKYFEGLEDHFEIFDPCDNVFNQSWKTLNGQASSEERKMRGEVLSESLDGKEQGEILWITRTQGIGLIVPKDREFVKQADIILADMNHYDTNKPILGSFFELAWAYDAQEKSVIGIYDGYPKDNYICSHPFVKATVDVWVRDEKSACVLLEHYFVKASTAEEIKAYRRIKNIATEHC